ncbi:M48 family metallopeptidase [Clostridium sp. SHJSY1]|uniref:M48 family metallopeptidase n=1 Tax=Clostridium sp. SHJSY1 TaxID=2942483 RepID=UPI002874AE90|nr:SprT family zinc-dependent metalloprotease [Clostridium sp. SHJSY1]MDS0526195.1 M48 family metallopeptidase [Clostridium sp. SHJSY1]
MMRLEFQYGTRIIGFNVIFRKRKTLEISVEPPDIITVVAPLDTPEDVIINKTKSKAKWIVEQLYSFKNMQYKKINREFVNGESFLYLGRNYSLQIVIDEDIKNAGLKLYKGKFYITTRSKDNETIEKAMKEWYRKKTKEKIEERIKYYERYFNIKPTSIKVKEQQKRWGSCTIKNELFFNWRCVMAKANVLDYIIVHEMCHLYHKNHSKEFWELLNSVMPDFESRKEWLKNNGVKMNL